jgi:ABC-type sugar transport system substrate-binding protein
VKITRTRTAIAALLASGAVLAGCGSDSADSGAAGGTRANGTLDAGGKKIVYASFYRAPLAQNIAGGAKDAATATGASFDWVGPANIDPPTAVKNFQDAVAAGADGVIVGAFPSEIWRVPIDRAGVPVVTADVYSAGSKATTHVAPDKYELGVQLANAFDKTLPAGASGTIYGGICVPELPALVTPQQGFAETITKLRPEVTFTGNLPTDVDPSKNFTQWQRIIQQHPDALGFIGQCDQDVPNLIKLRKDTAGATFLLGATSGDGVENIEEIKAGNLVAIASQNGWPEGYLGAMLLLRKLVNGTEPPKGWIDTGITLITKENADTVIARIKDPSLSATQFKSLVDKVLTDPAAATKPYTDCRGCGNG